MTPVGDAADPEGPIKKGPVQDVSASLAHASKFLVDTFVRRFPFLNEQKTPVSIITFKGPSVLLSCSCLRCCPCAGKFLRCGERCGLVTL